MSSNDRGDAPVEGQPAVARQRAGRPTPRAQRTNGSSTTKSAGSSNGKPAASSNGKGSGSGNGKPSSDVTRSRVDPRNEDIDASKRSTRPASKRAAGRTLTVAPDLDSSPGSNADGATQPVANNGVAAPIAAAAVTAEVAKNGSTLARTRDLLRGRRLPGASPKRVDGAPSPITSEVTNIAALTALAPALDEPTTTTPLVPMRPNDRGPDTQPEVRAVPLILPQPLVDPGEIAIDEYPQSDPAPTPVTRGHRVVQFGPGGRRRRPRVRRVTRVVRHIDPWSMFKIALVFSFVLYGVCLTAGVLLWNVAYTTGTIDNLERFFESFGWQTFEFKGGQLYHNAWIGGLFAAVGLTGLIVLGATLFNLITDLVGGIRVTVLEEEVVERHPSVARPLLRRRTGEIRIANEGLPPESDFDDLLEPPLSPPEPS